MITRNAIAVCGLVGAVACSTHHGHSVFNDDPTESVAGSTSSGDEAMETTASAMTTGTTTGVDDGTSGTVDSGGPIFDVGGTGGGISGCGCELHYIWIANAEQGTVSKVNTRTLQEEGRYYTRPDGAGNPSRTSVNLAGDVAVANRHGGLVKFHADPADCVESNEIPGIQTSQGANDIVPWDLEECRAWYTEFPTTNQRPVAWTPGEVVPGTCDSEGERVWTVTSAAPGLAPGTGGMGGVIAYLVEGSDGSIVQEIPIDDFSGFQLGAYGGAVDAAGNLYFTPMGAVSFDKKMARVNIDDFSVDIFPLPANVNPYGITVDHNGKVWVSSTFGSGAARFDPDTEVWDTVGGFISVGGLAEGPDNAVWIATDAGAVSIDIDTLSFGKVFVTQTGGTVKGISTDIDGFVWAVNNVAFKVDPATGVAVGTYGGLTSPYTYSDMTGYALGNVTCPPAG